MTTEFGCDRCYGDDATATMAYFRTGGLAADHRIVEDSHFTVSLHHCNACGQGFVIIFTEFVTMSGDAQYQDYVPVTPDEAATIRAKGRRINSRFLELLGSLGADRKRLSNDWPGNGPSRLDWRTGKFRVVEGY